MSYAICSAARLAAVFLLLGACTGGGTSDPAIAPPGAQEPPKVHALEAGAALMQTDNPAAKLDIHLSGFHPMKEQPEHQMVASHFCRQVNEDFAQCVLFDGSSTEANLNGVEYIISERLFEQLPRDERSYWHPHNAEILSGQLVAPNLPAVADRELMRSKMNSYGKTWHTWNSRRGTAPGDHLPLGPAVLAWSFNRDGEAEPGLVESRDRAMDISTPDRRRDRQALIELARPQEGVDALAGKFGRPTQPIPGVVDKEAAAGIVPSSDP